MHDVPEDLTIPAFLRRDPSEITTLPKQVRPRRSRKIPYPKDGFAMKGKRAATRERHRAALRRRAEQMRNRGKP